MQNKIEALYVHIPFCDDICSYCDFCKLIYNKTWADDYLSALFLELDSYKINKVKTIYVGGGTPTSLTDEQFEKLLNRLVNYLDDEYEFTLEANVESLTISKLELMKKYKVNRLSIGVQSSNDETLKLMDRHYSFIDAVNKVNLAKKYFDNINVDLIYAYPNETLDMLKEDIKNIISLDVDHISTYSLTISNSTKFHLKGYKEASEDTQRDMYDEILKNLRNASYIRYEVSNFARNNKFSKHNLTYWNNNMYYGVGLGASGYIDNIRYKNTSNIHKYLSKNFEKEIEEVSLKDKEEYFLMLKLRKQDGFSLKEYYDEFNKDFLNEYKDNIKKLVSYSLLEIKNDRIFATDEGIILLDRILLELFK